MESAEAQKKLRKGLAEIELASAKHKLAIAQAGAALAQLDVDRAGLIAGYETGELK